MAKLERVTAKIFASDAPADKIGQFGSALAGTKLETGDVSTIQALPAYTEGWSSAVISQRNYPVLQETNGVMKNMTYQTAYIMQNGIAEYDPNTEYYTGSICKGIGNTNQYASWGDENVGNDVTNSQYWKNVTPVNYSNITNCLLEIPQRIKYDLTDGTLTIKAGSVVIVPYGTTDRTSEFPVGATFLNNNFKVYDTQFKSGKFFVWAELQGNKSIGNIEATGDCFIFVDIDNGALRAFFANVASSGTVDGSGVTYRTDLNKCRFSNFNLTLPLGIVNYQSNVLASIDQVFNGMGYIGSTVWVDKGVKGLIPNGRNEDGTLNNINLNFEDLKLYTYSSTHTHNKLEFAWTNTDQRLDYMYFDKNNWTFDEYQNYFVYRGNVSVGWMSLGSLSITNGVISAFNPKPTFRAIDYNDVDGQIIPLFKSALSSTSIAYNGTITCDLSDYLPKDGNLYEVECSLWGTSEAGSGKGFNFAIASDYVTSMHGMAYNVSRASAAAYGSSTCHIVVGNKRFIRIVNNISSGAGTSTVGFQLHSYRKVR